MNDQNLITRCIKSSGKARWWVLIIGVLLFGWFAAAPAAPTNFLSWQAESEQLTADVREVDLVGVLSEVARQTGWHVFVEPDPQFRASVKFSNLPVRVGLRRLLGEMNFAMLPATNQGPQRLYVFRTGMHKATQRVNQGMVRAEPKARKIPNELIVRVKPGTDVAALAALVGAKVVGYIPELNAYRFQFADEAAAEAARAVLEAQPGVVSVENNYYVDAPLTPQSLTGRAASDASLKLDPPKADGCKVVIGMVDTTLQKLSPALEPFVKDRIAVAGGGGRPGAAAHPCHGHGECDIAGDAGFRAEFDFRANSRGGCIRCGSLRQHVQCGLGIDYCG